MGKDPRSEVSDSDLDTIAEAVKEGMTSGLIDTDEGYRCSWNIEINKFKD